MEPVPEKRSRTELPGTFAARMEKMASLAIWGVGLTSSPLGETSFRPLCSPPLMRRWLMLLA